MIVIIDYGAGNTRSVMNALDRLGSVYELTDDPSRILAADKVIFPGVGHANHAMNSLNQRNLVDVIGEVKQPLLGICVGMQLLFDSSEEGNTQCLGIIEGTVSKFNEDKVIVPQMGWNTINRLESNLFKDIKENEFMYLVHSFYAEMCQNAISSTNYELDYASALQRDNFYGVQFHPEKSSLAGEQMLRNFINL